MSRHMCDLCGVRPATVRVGVVQDRQRKQLSVGDYHYAQLTRHQRQISPLESLFRGGRFADYFIRPTLGGGLQHSGTVPSGAVSEPDGVNLQQHFSDQSKDILQRAAERAVRFGRREVDTEHLLYELVDNETVQRILAALKVSGAGLQEYIDQHALREETTTRSADGAIAVSPRLKSALERAFIAPREFGQSYVGPEHMLAGLAEVTDSFAGDLLIKYGLTPRSCVSRHRNWVGPMKAAASRSAGRPNSTNTAGISRVLHARARSIP